MKKRLKAFTIMELIIIALMAGLGLAVKPIIVPLVHIVTGPLTIPGGAVAGGLYMLWIVLAMGLIKKKGTCALVALVQGMIVITVGTIGSHGIASILTYTLPGVFAELAFLLPKNKEYNVLNYMIGCILANVVGTYGSNLLFFHLPLIPLIVSLTSAALSGALGGVIAYNIVNKFDKYL